MAEEGQVIAIHKVEDFDPIVAKATESAQLIVVDFTASWCPPCRLIAPEFARLAKEFVGVVFVKVDVDEVRVMSDKFKVTAMPTFVFLIGGNEVDRFVGADKVNLEKKVRLLKDAAATSTA